MERVGLTKYKKCRKVKEIYIKTHGTESRVKTSEILIVFKYVDYYNLITVKGSIWLCIWPNRYKDSFVKIYFDLI